jgi:adenylate cyclase class IV
MAGARWAAFLAATAQPSGGAARLDHADGIEFERAYESFDEAKVREALASQADGAGRTHLFRTQNFAAPDLAYSEGDTPTTIRVRDEGARGTVMTVKRPSTHEDFDREDEVVLDADSNMFKRAVGFLDALGVRRSFRTEKLREIFTVQDDEGTVEVVFDGYPGISVAAEVEGPSAAAVDRVAAALGFGVAKRSGVAARYLALYGIPTNRPFTDLTFDNAAEVLGTLATQNQGQFAERLRTQQETIAALSARA